MCSNQELKVNLDKVAKQGKQNSKDIKDIKHNLDWSNGAFKAMWIGAVNNLTKWLGDGLKERPVKTIKQILKVVGVFASVFIAVGAAFHFIDRVLGYLI